MAQAQVRPPGLMRSMLQSRLLSIPLPCMNNEAFWCRSDVVERITSNQGQFRIDRRAKHSHILRIDDFGTFHSIFEGANGGCECEPILRANLSQ